MTKKLIFIALLFLTFTTHGQKNTFLERAYWKGNPSIKDINQKINEGNNIAQLNNNAFDAVVYALLENVDNETIKYLLSKKGNGVNKLTHDGRTYIFWAAYRDNLKMMKYLVSNGAKTDIIDSHGYSVLNFAASTGQTDIKLYDFLFKMNASIKTERNHNGANALLLAAPYAKDFTLINYFISKGATLNDLDNNSNGIFEYAAKGGNIDFLKALIKKGVDTGKNAMIFASQGLRNKKNTLETYKYLESVGLNPNTFDKKNNRNPLHSIAYNSRDLAIYSYFISKGVDVNLQDKEGNSPFMNAANSNTLEVIQFLSKYVKDINNKNENGRSALAMAVNRNSIDVVKFLLKKGANIHTIDAKGNTLSYYLINNYSAKDTNRFEEKLKLLQENGFVFNQKQNSGNTLLHIATERNNLSLLKRLANFNINVNTKNDEGLSALQVAAMTAKDDKILKYLISIGAAKTIKTDLNETVYQLAAENELLQKNKIDIQFLK